MTRAPIENKKSPLQPITSTVLPNAKVCASLRSIYVSRKPLTVTTEYIHPILHIVGP